MSGYPVAFRAAGLTAVLIIALAGAWSMAGPTAAQGVEATPVAAQLDGEVHACASALDGRLRHVEQPICAPDETLITFNETNRIPAQLILCAASPQDPLRRVADISACQVDLVVFTVPDERVETRLCVDDGTGAFRRQQDGACSAGTERELVIPAGPSITPTPVPPTATSAPPTGTPVPTAQAENTPAPEATATTGFRAAGNQAPDPRDRRLFTLEDSASFLVTLIATDADGNAISFKITSPPTKGALGSIFGTACTGTIPRTCTASVRYNSNRNAFGYDSFTYRASDGISSATATITIRIQGVNDAPTFTKGPNVTTPEDKPINMPWATNVKEGPPNEVTQSLHFVIYANSNPGLFAMQPAVSPSGRLSYTPAAEATGSATIKLRLHDSGGTANGGDDTSSLYKFTITITPANDAPSFTPGSDVTVDEDSGPYSAAWASNMSPGPPDESSQTTRFVASTEDLDLFTDRPRIDPAGVLTFTPAPDADGVATIRVRIRDDGSRTNPGDRYQSSPAYILTITITPINDEPGFTKGPNVIVDEDSGPYSAAWATNIDPGAPFESAQTLTFEITGNSNSGLFGSGPSVGADGTLAFTPAANANGSATIDIRLTDNGGTANGGDDASPVQSFTITVTAVNDAPVDGVPGGQTVNEDTALVFSGANGSLLSISDVDAGGASVQVTLSVEHGALTLGGTSGLAFSAGNGTGDATMSFSGSIANINTALDGLTYIPTSNFNSSQGAETLSIHSDDQGNTGAGGAQTDTDNVTISVTAVNDGPSFTLGGNQTVVQDAGAQTVSGFATAISAGPSDESAQTLTFTVTNDNNSLFSAQPDVDEATGDLTYTPAAAQTGSALVTVVLSDNGGTANGGDDTSGQQTFTITVRPPNALPEATAQSVSTDEDTPKTITLSGSDTEGAALTFAIVEAPDHGGLGAIGVPVCAGTPSACTADVIYTPDANYAGPDSFTFTVSDGTSDSALATVSITINPVNDAPVVDTSAGSANYTENDPAVVIDPALTVSDVDNANLPGATVSITGGFAGGDDLVFVNQLGITGVYNTGTGELTLTGTATVAQYQTALRSISYRSTSENPSTASRTVSFQVDDGAAANNLSNVATRSISVAAVNDAPVLALIEAQILGATEQVATPITATLTVSDVDTAALTGATIRFVSGFVAGQDSLGFTNQNGITGSINATTGALTLSGTTTLANYQTALRSITYTNSSNAPETITTRVIGFVINDGAGANNLSSEATRDVNVTAVNDAPTAATRNLGANSIQTNMRRSFAASDGLLKDAADPDAGGGFTPTFTVGTVNGVAPVSGTITTTIASVGTVTANQTTGAFDFNPAPGVTGSVNFSYTICDDGNPAPSQCSAAATITVNIAGPVIWFVNSAAATNGTGTLASPFNTLAAADAVDAANHRVFLYSGTATTGIALNTGEWLIGQGVTGGAGDDFDDIFGITPPTGTIDRPAIGSGTATVQNTVTLNTNAVVKALALATTTNTGLSDPAGAITGVSVDQTTVNTTTGTGLSLSDIAGTLSFSGLTTTGGPGASLTGSNGSATFNFTGVSVSSGANPAFTATGGGTVNVTGSANTLTTTTGTALALSNITGTLTLANVSANGGANGITMVNASVTIAIAAGTIQNTTNLGVFIDSGTPAFSFAGTVDNSAGRSVQVEDLTGGTVTFSGTIDDDGLGILVQNNSTGGAKTITFSGASKIITTGNNAAVQLSSNTGATIIFSGGGLDIDTTGGAGFSATGGGTVTVTGAANTIATTTGTALTVANTTIGASGLTFRSISANGAASGIVLNATGASGGLTVAGTGTANSGGTIQNTTGHGISLTSTLSPSFTNVRILNAGGSGVDGTQVTNFTFVNGRIENAGDGERETCIGFFNGTGGAGFGTNLTGTLTVTGNVLIDCFYSAIEVEANNGTLANATISSNTITTTTNGHGISLIGTGTASTVFNLTRATIANNTISDVRGAGVQIVFSNASATGTGATAGIPGSLTDIISITGNSISPKDTGTHAIAFSTGGGNPASRTRANFAISNNPSLLGSDIGTVVLVGNNGYSTMTGVVQGNVIDANHTPGLGGGNGIGGGNGVSGAGNAWTPDLTLTVSSNTITDTDGNGILLVGRSTSGIARLKILDNTVAAPLGGVRPGIRVDAGNASSADDAVCVQIAGNASAGSGGSQGIGLRKQGTVPTTNDFSIVGMAATSSPGVEAYVDGLNPAGGGTLLISATSGFTSCSAF
jgi:large repetitive protein